MRLEIGELRACDKGLHDARLRDTDTTPQAQIELQPPELVFHRRSEVVAGFNLAFSGHRGTNATFIPWFPLAGIPVFRYNHRITKPRGEP